MTMLIHKTGKNFKKSETITILHIVISFSTGGLEKFVLDLVNVNKNKYINKLICLESIGDLAEDTEKSDLLCLHMQPGLNFRHIAKIYSIVKENRVNLIHTHNEKAQFYGALAGCLCRIPVIHTKHGKNLVAFKPRLRNNFLARFCNRIVAVSRDAAIQCIEDEKIPATKVTTILNGIDTDCFSPGRKSATLRASLGIKEGVPVFGIVARLAPVKDHATLIDACKILKDSGLDFRLLVIGDGPLRTDLVSRVNELGLQDCIIFTGARHDIADLLNVLDIYALSSTSEGISLTLLEAMSCCLPVVATAVGGNPEVVLDGETGFLVPPQTPAEFAKKLLILTRDHALRYGMGKAGRERVKDQFSIDKTAVQYDEVYREALNIKSTSA